MSINPKKKLSKLTYFGNLTTKYCEQKNGQKITFHDAIQENKNFIFNFLDSQPYYNELMPTIIKNNRGSHFYKKILKKGLEAKSDFFKGIMRAIKHSNDEEPTPKIQERNKSIKHYQIPRIELLKKRKEKYDKYLLKKNKTVNNRIKTLINYNSMITILNSKNQPTPSSESNIKSKINNNTLNNFSNFNHTNYNLNSTLSGDTFHTNYKKNESMSNFHNKYTLQNKNNHFNFNNAGKTNSSFRDLINNFIYPGKKLKKNQKTKFVKLLNKCNERLNFAMNIGGDVEKLNKNKSVEELNKKIKDKLKNVDQKVIEEKGLRNKKYQQLEKEKFRDLKRKMDIKVSDEYAYINRKEYNEFMRDNETIFAYQIYLREMNKINEKLAKKKVVEKKNISIVKNLLENTFRQKEFLKYKIDNYHTKHAKQDKLKIFNFKNKDDFYINKNNDKDELKGTLLPKLCILKDYCYGRKNYKSFD